MQAEDTQPQVVPYPISPEHPQPWKLTEDVKKTL